AGLVPGDGMNCGGADLEMEASQGSSGDDASPNDSVTVDQKLSGAILFGMLSQNGASMGGGSAAGSVSGDSGPPAAGFSSRAIQQSQVTGRLCLSDAAFRPPAPIRSIFHPPRLS